MVAPHPDGHMGAGAGHLFDTWYLPLIPGDLIAIKFPDSHLLSNLCY